ncbi:MAG: chromosome segregation protein SMC, partial [Pseudomonadota bacterium]
IEGDLWRWDGLVASAEAPTAAALRLAQKNRLAELESLVGAAGNDLKAAQEVYDQGKERTAQCIEKELSSRQTLKDCQRELSLGREALIIAERAVSQLGAKRSALEEAQKRLTGDLEELNQRLTETQAALAAMPDTSDMKESLEALKFVVAEDRAKLAEARASFEGLSREAEARGRRLETIKLERANWQRRLANASKQIEALNSRRQEAVEELEKLQDAPEQIDTKRKSLLERMDKAEQERSSAAELLAQGESAQREADKLARAALETLSSAREQVGRSEERLAAAKDRRSEIEARIREELECHPSETISLAEIAPDDPLPELGKIESKLERFKAERERLGAVNLRAEAEQEEIQEKRDEIISERDDLIAAIAKLRSGIQSLNKEGRERLLEAFEVVNKEFKRLFTHLFGGGTAELQLVESDDPLEAGLEILARPPGKKPQTMTLLSGGEQALTAMALIFAVFLTNPAPICVLDEVDAPLDDHNVERFCNLMDEMVSSTQTRFILITHNPITMARMDRMFGVTMAERGVSQLVSVNLEQAEKIRDSA